MIILRESNHKRVSGLKSIFVSFEYSKDIIAILKQLSQAIYDSKTKEWEVPITSLSYLIDNLTYLDDIKLILDKEVTESTQLEPVLTYKTNSFKHQSEAVRYGLNHHKWLLLDSPGLGKSKSIINLAEELKEQKGIQHCLVICGINTLKTNWEKEIEKHSYLDSVVIGKRVNKKGNVVYASIKERARQLREPIKEFFVIINIECLRDDTVVDAIMHSDNKFDMMCFDEAHKAKGWSSAQGKGLLNLSAEYMIAMTGTLLMNNPLDAYVPLAWIGVEKKHNVTNFKSTYCIYDTLTRGKIIGFKNLNLLKDEIESCSLRRTKDLLNLPVKTVINEYVEMSDKHRDFYVSVEKGVKEECDKIDLKTNGELSLITRLRQATSCPSALTTQDIESSKIERCLSLVEEITSQNDKVVIFSNFKEPIYHLQTLLKDYKPLIGTGDMKDEEVSRNIDKFQNEDVNKVFLGTIQKMGTGVTLTRASYLIFLDCPWTEALYQQACDRIHRIGSTKPVFIYNLICENTIDVAVSKIISKKGAFSDYVIDDKVTDKSLEILKQYILDLK